MTPEHKQKISEALKGRRPKNLDALHRARKGAKLPSMSEDKHPFWKGDKVGYTALHAWVRRQLGTPQVCWRCGTSTAKVYHWANISRQYKRDLSDWERLCPSCHKKDHFAKGEVTIWNKGLTGLPQLKNSGAKKGMHNSPETEFKKGITPHNKYLEPRPCGHCGKLFQPLDNSRRFCSYDCYWASMRSEKWIALPDKTATCIQCGNTFNPKQPHYKFCGLPCYWQSKRGKPVKHLLHGAIELRTAAA